MKEITSLDELKSIELDIMKKIHAFCEKHGLTYYLAYGTMIGAIRHDGFIPWDDDIDIFMPREDYDKFLELFVREQDSLKLAVVNHTTKPYLGRAMSKVIDNRTRLIEMEYKNDDEIGVFVDVFPLDGLPEGSLQKKIHMFKCKLLSKIFYTKKEIKKKSVLDKLILLLSSPFNEKLIIDCLVKNMKKYKYSECKEVIVYAAHYYRIMPKTMFAQKVLHPFEDAMFYIHNGYDELLRMIYGDYMQLPPEKDRIPHHIANIYWK